MRPCVPIPADLIAKETANYFGLHSSADQQFYYLSASLYVFPDNVFSDYAKEHEIASDTYLEAGSLQCIYTSNIRLFNSETDRYEDCEPIRFPKNSELTLGTLTIPSESPTTRKNTRLPRTPIWKPAVSSVFIRATYDFLIQKQIAMRTVNRFAFRKTVN